MTAYIDSLPHCVIALFQILCIFTSLSRVHTLNSKGLRALFVSLHRGPTGPVTHRLLQYSFYRRFRAPVCGLIVCWKHCFTSYPRFVSRDNPRRSLRVSSCSRVCFRSVLWALPKRDSLRECRVTPADDAIRTCVSYRLSLSIGVFLLALEPTAAAKAVSTTTLLGMMAMGLVVCFIQLTSSYGSRPDAVITIGDVRGGESHWLCLLARQAYFPWFYRSYTQLIHSDRRPELERRRDSSLSYSELWKNYLRQLDNNNVVGGTCPLGLSFLKTDLFIVRYTVG